MARPRTSANTKKLQVTLPNAAYAYLEDMVELELYGTNVSEVARHLLTTGLDAAIRDKLIERRTSKQ